jgi:hypothetical protein
LAILIFLVKGEKSLDSFAEYLCNAAHAHRHLPGELVFGRDM